MLHKTHGIVFRYVKYGETSIIATLYTQLFGITTFIVNGVRSSRSKGKIALFQPLSLVDLVIYHKESRNINRISEIKSLDPLNDLRTNIIKSSIALFIIEVLNKCIKEEEPNEALFDFLTNSIIRLNEAQSNYENFHLTFLLKLTKYLGFAPQNSTDFFVDIQSLSRTTTSEHQNLIEEIINHDFGYILKMDFKTRSALLEDIILFYKVHMDLPELKSVKILHTLLKD